MSPPRPQIIMGGGLIGSGPSPSAAATATWTDIFRGYNHTRIDTGAAYPPDNPGASETLLAEAGATAWCTVDTKVLSTEPGAHARERVLGCIESSLKRLGFLGESGEATGKGQVDVMYLHIPCLDTPLEETAGAMDESFRRGWFRRFGLSNYTPWHVESLCEIAKGKGWVVPTVYQGQYNPVCRTGEKDLFPVLRKHGISFFAYTPTAAGLFSGKVNANSIHNTTGRWSHSHFIGKFYSSIYLRPELLDAANRVHTKTQEHGFSGHEAALRWCLHHSALRKDLGDGVIVGASSLEQFEVNLKACDAGPLPQDLVEVFEEIWPLAEPVAPYAYVDSQSDVFKDTVQSMADEDKKY